MQIINLPLRRLVDYMCNHDLHHPIGRRRISSCQKYQNGLIFSVMRSGFWQAELLKPVTAVSKLYERRPSK